MLLNAKLNLDLKKKTMKKTLFPAILTYRLSWIKNDCYRHNKTSKTEIKTSRLDFNVNLELAIYGEGLVINDGMTATGYIHYALDKNKTIPLVLGGAGFDGKYTEINYFVQYQKNNLSIAGFIQYDWD
jgi:hypothetical protein